MGHGEFAAAEETAPGAVGASQAARQQAQNLMRQIRTALNAGQVSQAIFMCRQLDSMRIREDSFAPAEDSPGKVFAAVHEAQRNFASGVIQAGGSVTLDEAIFAGWIAVFAPFDLQIYEGKRFLGTTENERIMLKAGRHDLELVNTRLGFHETRAIDVKPGATVPVNGQSAQGTLRIAAPAGIGGKHRVMAIDHGMQRKLRIRH